MAQKIRMGFIGCGGNASGHVKRTVETLKADVEVVALNDTSRASLDRLVERVPEVKGLPTFADYREMLKDVEMDAVQISTPHTLHFEQIMASLDKGLHVLTEKPMVCTVDHARQVIARAEAVKKVLMISYQRHFGASFRFIRNMIRTGELGEIQFISALQDQNWLRATRGAWRQVLALSGGGQLNDSGSHLLDIILWMTDLRVDEVSAFMEYFGGEVDINSTLSLKFTNGALGSLSIVGNGPRGMWEDITIWGSRGAIYSRNGKIHCQFEGGQEVFEPQGLPSGYTSPDRNFVDAVLGRDEVQVPPVCGLRVIELTESAWASAKQGGKPVKVKR
jgi:predicted dehydrogenase